MMSYALAAIPDVSMAYKEAKACWATNPDAFRDWWVSLPHPKGSLRKHHNEAYKLAMTGEDTYHFKVQAKLKREIAKYLKAPRLFVSYEEYGIFIPWVIDLVKKCLDGVWRSDGTKVTFVETNLRERSWFEYFQYGDKRDYKYVELCLYPSPERLQRVFTTLMYVCNGSAGNTMYSVVFGDDGATATYHNGSGRYIMTDIASCDNSIGDGYFQLFHEFLVDTIGGALADQWSQQHRKDVILSNPNDCTQSVVLKPTRRVMGSGTTVTTLLGSLCNVDIVECMWRYQMELSGMGISSQESDGAVEAAVQRAGAVCGFAMTAEVTVILERVQFLKRSPYMVDGVVYHALNRGTMIRSIGCVDDIFQATQFPGLERDQFNELREGKGGELILADIFFSGIIRGYVNEPACPIVLALRSRFRRTEEVLAPERYYQLGESRYPEIPVEFFANRYGITSDELDQAARLIEGVKYGEFVQHTMFAKLLKTDYGYASSLIPGEAPACG